MGRIGWLVLLIVQGVAAQTLQNLQVRIVPVSEEGRYEGFTLLPARQLQPLAIIRFGSLRKIVAEPETVTEKGATQIWRFDRRRAMLTPILDGSLFEEVRLRAHEPYLQVRFRLQLQGFDAGAWEKAMGRGPFHFLACSLPGAEIFHQRGWMIGTPVIDRYTLLNASLTNFLSERETASAYCWDMGHGTGDPLRTQLEWLAEHATRFPVNGNVCVSWRKPIKGDGREHYGKGVFTFHNVQTVHKAGDGFAAVGRYLSEGDILLVFASQPFPFYYFPTSGDLRWRPMVRPKGEEGLDFVYTPLLTLRGEAGKEYGDGTVVVEHQTGELAGNKIAYMWHALWQTEVRGPLLLGLLRWAAQTTTERPPVEQTIVYRTANPIRIDGKLDEPEWCLATPLLLRDIKGRQAPATVARLLWDERYLYIAFECADPDIWATKTKRDDFLWEEEVVEVFIDPDGDGRNYYEFQVNPLGTQIDLLIPDAVEGVKFAKRNAEWNCQGWLSTVQGHGTVNQRSDTDEGWTVEMAIPFSELPHPASLSPRPAVAWRLNLYRIDRPKGREGDPLLLSWSKCLTWFHEPDRFGRIFFAGNPLADDFRWYPNGSDGRPTWCPQQGEWEIRDGAYFGADSGTDGFIALGSKLGFDNWRDYEVTVQFRVLEFGSDWRDGFWLAFRFTDVGNAYSLNFYHGQGGIVHLHKARNGISTGDENPMATAQWTPDHEWHEVRVQVKGNRITAWLDGRQLFSVADEQFNALPPVEQGAIVLSARRCSQSQGHTRIAIRHIRIQPLNL